MSTATDSRIVDGNPQNAPGNLDELETSIKGAIADGQSAQTDDKNKAGDSGAAGDDKPTKPDWIEGKFWTGDLAESAEKQAKGYRDLHSAYGRMANDLGTQRKMTDQILQGKRSADLGDPSAQQQKAALPKIDPRKLVDNPNEALEPILTAHATQLRSEWEQEQRQTQMQQQEQEFLAKYPDYSETASDEQFKQWVWSSPLRHKAAVLAAQGDYGAAGALMDEWSVAQNPDNIRTDKSGNNVTTAGDDVEGARKAGTESAAQANGSGQSGKSGRVYRRADLIKLRMERPEQYSDPAFQAEIMAAYVDGRVK